MLMKCNARLSLNKLVKGCARQQEHISLRGARVGYYQ